IALVLSHQTGDGRMPVLDRRRKRVAVIAGDELHPSLSDSPPSLTVITQRNLPRYGPRAMRVPISGRKYSRQEHGDEDDGDDNPEYQAAGEAIRLHRSRREFSDGRERPISDRVVDLSGEL